MTCFRNPLLTCLALLIFLQGGPVWANKSCERALESSLGPLVLRPLLAADVEGAVALALDPQVRNLSGDHGSERSWRESFLSALEIPAEERRRLELGLFLGGRLVGLLSLSARTIANELECQLFRKGEVWVPVGYYIAPEFWGQGLASRVVRESIKIAEAEFGATGLVAKVTSYNTRSQQVLKKNGFTQYAEIDGYLYFFRHRSKTMQNFRMVCEGAASFFKRD